MEAPKDRTWTWETENYSVQNDTIWPGRGCHILAQYDDEAVVVYQAFKKEIADYAVEHQRFHGCKAYNESRMTWIKSNFMWMMFRCGWAEKSNQEAVLAIWLKRDVFDSYLANCRTKGSVRDFKGTVRLQWDPDHLPNGDPHHGRRAVQLGLKNVPGFASGRDILQIKDVTAFVREQAKHVQKKGYDKEQLLAAKERVYKPLTKEALQVFDQDGGAK